VVPVDLVEPDTIPPEGEIVTDLQRIHHPVVPVDLVEPDTIPPEGEIVTDLQRIHHPVVPVDLVEPDTIPPEGEIVTDLQRIHHPVVPVDLVEPDTMPPEGEIVTDLQRIHHPVVPVDLVEPDTMPPEGEIVTDLQRIHHPVVPVDIDTRTEWSDENPLPGIPETEELTETVTDLQSDIHLHKSLLQTQALTQTGKGFQLDSIQFDVIDGWNLGAIDQHFAGDFNGDGKDEIFIRSPEWAGLLSYNGTKFQLDSIQFDWINGKDSSVGGWNLGDQDKHYVGDFNGDGKDDVFIRSPEWAGLLTYNGTKFQVDSIQFDWINGKDSSVGGWNLSTVDQQFIGDFNDDGKDDVFIRSPEWAGLLTYNGTNFQVDSIQFDWIDGWNLSAVDQHFVGEFVRDNTFDDRDDIFIRSPQWAGLLTYDVNKARFQLKSIQSNKIGNWQLSAGDQHFVGDFNGDSKDDIFIRSPKYAGLLTYDDKKASFQSKSIQSNKIGGWILSAVDQHFVGEFNGDGKDDIFIRSPEYAGLLTYDDKKASFQSPSIQFDVIGGWNLGAVDRHFIGNFNGDATQDVFIRSPEWAGLLTYDKLTFNSRYGHGLVNAAAAVARAIGQPTFADVPDLGGNNWGNDRIKAPEVWAQGFTGAGITVAVIDSGVDINHPDLNGNIWTNAGEIAGDGIDNDGNGFIDDINGWNFGSNNNNIAPSEAHGTHVAGTIAALNNTLGATGVAPNAQIMPIRIADNTGQWNGNLANAIRYAVDNGARVINMSLYWSDSQALRDALAYAASRNVITVMAAGNFSGASPTVPASYANQYGLSVGAVDSKRTIWPSSNRAGSNSSLQQIVAPGVRIFSTLPSNNYDSWKGTSMATPHVAGVVALMLDANPNLTQAQVRQILTSTATRLA
jgi:hypothetical protein